MADPTRQGPRDAVRIDLDDREEVARWAEVLGCTPAELRHAVASVGALAERVRHYLARQKPPANDPLM